MRRVRTGKRGRWISLFAVGFLGYLLGGWQAANNHATEMTAAQSVALRFPEASIAAAVASPATEIPTGTVSDTALKDARLALFSPQPMEPPNAPNDPAAAPVPAQLQAMTPLVVPAATATAIANPPAATPKPVRIAAVPRRESKVSTNSLAPGRTSHPAFLSDAQIAGIKERLHLTSDQERMWPAVEAALRNIAYAKARDARRHGAPETTRTAALDPDSAEVQGLKSAAIPLLMSFSDEQKDEVRNLAHGMGLDQLATEF